MPPLPVLSAREAVAAFERFGWRVVRQESHIMMAKAGVPFTLSVPNHKEVARGTLRSLIRNAGLTVTEFLAVLN